MIALFDQSEGKTENKSRWRATITRQENVKLINVAPDLTTGEVIRGKRRVPTPVRFKQLALCDPE
jgi:hypothetical protein